VRLPVHVKVDTGTHRQGLDPRKQAALAAAAKRMGLEVAGVATHFANIEDTTGPHLCVSPAGSVSGTPSRPSKRASAGSVGCTRRVSAAALLFREADFSMVRIGISLYGHWPSKETYLSWAATSRRDGVKLQPALLGGPGSAS